MTIYREGLYGIQVQSVQKYIIESITASSSYVGSLLRAVTAPTQSIDFLAFVRI